MPSSLHIVFVHVHVKPERIEDFRAAATANARASVEEPRVARFDVVQDVIDPSRFVLVESYRDAAAAAEHKETAHYRRWRDVVADMMAEPRSSRQYVNVFPDDGAW
jgi:autoinducer 2-degrading protein